MIVSRTYRAYNRPTRRLPPAIFLVDVRDMLALADQADSAGAVEEADSLRAEARAMYAELQASRARRAA